MKILVPIFSLILTLLSADKLNFVAQLLHIPEPLSFNQFSKNNQIPEEFARLIKLKGAKQTNLLVSIKPKAKKISAKKLKTAVNGDVSILSIPIEITNSSSQTISMK